MDQAEVLFRRGLDLIGGPGSAGGPGGDVLAVELQVLRQAQVCFAGAAAAAGLATARAAVVTAAAAAGLPARPGRAV